MNGRNYAPLSYVILYATGDIFYLQFPDQLYRVVVKGGSIEEISQLTSPIVGAIPENQERMFYRTHNILYNPL